MKNPNRIRRDGKPPAAVHQPETRKRGEVRVATSESRGVSVKFSVDLPIRIVRKIERQLGARGSQSTRLREVGEVLQLWFSKEIHALVQSVDAMGVGQ